MYSTSKQQRPLVKLALVAAVACAGLVLSAPGHAADATATASGTVITPIAIVSTANLAFGNFAPGVGGTVTVSTSGVRSGSGVILTTGAPASAARFDITGQAGTTYAITHSGTTVLTNTTGSGGETMTLTKFSDLTGANATSGNATSGTLSGAGAQSLFVGGTLTVGGAQVAGVYAGSVIATVEYNLSLIHI